ncbi:hypothetical protein DDZ18_07045 [Marinicauda salina]|uniref:DUF2793 domain-containing protein n=1 Tax=Marinicauda salina TaxID=2135793 RepID=A0A2U2BTV8_9PROT|nr:DUF2793 domain-containing protein [Marinicauda salina]PWE17429.1 hypothetical protein DDZ18_07045 [Marinicauda salina]
MSDDSTPRLGLPWLMPAQAQKHVTVNEALRRLDALVGPRALSRTTAAEPADPADGEAWILPAGASGARWDDFAENDLAVFQDGAWARYAPDGGLAVWVVDEARTVVFDGAAWRPAEELIETLQNLSRLGLGTAADAANPFAARLNAALWTALAAGAGGSGDLRVAFDKEAAANVVSLLLQSGASGRAEIGLVGDDDLAVKVSPDGQAWQTALSIDRATGGVDFSRGVSIAGTPAGALMFTPGGKGVNAIWRVDAEHSELPRTATIYAVSGDVITISGASADIFAKHDVWSGSSYLRIWNASKAPEEAAWMKAIPDWGAGNSQLQVTDAADIAGWAAGDTVRLGELAPSNEWVAAIDISPMMMQVFGYAFRQSGVMVKANLLSASAGDDVAVSPNGEKGDYVSASGTAVAGILSGAGVTIIPSTKPSPISNSNLVFVREKFATNATVELVSVMAVLQ